MKHKGSAFEYAEERDKDLMRAYTILLQTCDNIVMDDIWKNLANMPAERFWVSEERAAIVIARMMKGDKLEKMRSNSREMYEEIYRRVLIMKEESPNMSLADIIFKVIRQPAPKFYLTPLSLQVIVTRLKKRTFEKRRQRLRHCITPIKK